MSLLHFVLNAAVQVSCLHDGPKPVQMQKGNVLAMPDIRKEMKT